MESAEEMLAAVTANVARADIFVACAAVADYRPKQVAAGKIKKQQQIMQLELVRNPDILAWVAGQEHGPYTVGFAAETNDMEKNAIQKRRSKGVDMIAANQVGGGLGFDSTDNALHVFWENGEQQFPVQPKALLMTSMNHQNYLQRIKRLQYHPIKRLQCRHRTYYCN